MLAGRQQDIHAKRGLPAAIDRLIDTLVESGELQTL
jgi:hypothetical protein